MSSVPRDAPKACHGEGVASLWRHSSSATGPSRAGSFGHCARPRIWRKLTNHEQRCLHEEGGVTRGCGSAWVSVVPSRVDLTKRFRGGASRISPHRWMTDAVHHHPSSRFMSAGILRGCVLFGFFMARAPRCSLGEERRTERKPLLLQQCGICMISFAIFHFW